MSRRFLVIGGGFAGMAAAARAADLGASVTVLEKSDRIGGSAALSAGIVFTAPDLPTLRRVCPHGDRDLGEVLVEGFDAAVAEVAKAGVEVSGRWTRHLGFGVAHWIDIPALLAIWRDRLEAAGGRILCRTAARELIVEQGAVRGARIEQPAHDRAIEADAVLIATGGFQGDPALLRRLIGYGADEMLLRSNPNSTGDGLRMGLAAGAAMSSALDSFYGHLLPSPLERLRPEDHLPLAQYHSRAGLLVNRFGRRFVDESRGDEYSNQATLRQRGGRAVLLCDERVRTEHALGAPHPHGLVVDRLACARDAGAKVASASSLDQLVGTIDGWGVNGCRLRQTIARYNNAAGDGTSGDDAPMSPSARPLVTPPFHALEVQPSITFTFGGLRGDRDGRALDADDRPVPGLYVAGADLGGLQEGTYVGGLALGLVFGPHVAAAALRPRQPAAD